MQIVVNGQAREVAATTTVAQLLADLQLPLRQVAVEVNRDVVPRQRHDVHRLAPGDEVEVVTLVGGG